MPTAIRVLYVDDEPGLLTIGKMFLERSGDFSVATIGSAPAALDLLIREKFDAIISDYQMPEIDGIAFLKQLKASGNTTPFIIFTGKGREEVVIEALNEGADFYLQKGGDPKAQFAELANKIRNAVSRRCAEVDLRESEERYRNVVEDQTEFICRFLPDGTHVFVNEAYCRYFGLDQKEIIGTQFHPTIHPQDQENVVRLIASLTPDHPLMNIDQRIIMPDGSIRWQRWVDRAIFQLDGSLKEYQSVGRDITDWKQSEEALEESESFNRNLVENLPDYIAVYGPDGKILYVNPASVRVLGYSAEKLIGTPVLSYVAEEYRDIVVSRITDRLEGGEVHPYEIDLLSPDGLRRSVIVKGTPIRYHGSPATLLLLIDITERKLAEEALRENENKLDAIIRGSPIPQFVIDRDHNVINWNEALEKYSGITVEEILGTNQQWRAFYPSERPCLADILVDGAIEKVPHWYSGKYAKSKLIGDAYEATDFFPHMGESGIWLYFTAAPIHDEDGRVIGAVETLEDITERKVAEEALRQANQKLNLLTSITRHDINNQLTVLMGYLEILGDSKLDPSQNEYCSKVSTVAKHISAMIQFTREYEEIGVHAPVWQDTRTFVNPAVTAALPGQVIVKNDLPAGTEVFADPLIGKVFYNLVDNAVRCGGKITTIRFSALEREDEHIILCEDDGTGVPVEEKEKIFERGFGKNTGLGLFLSREILSITGITITETGEPGKGARFEMVVPKGMWRTAGDGV